MTKYTLIMGLNDQDSKLQEISTVEAYKIVNKLITSYTDGVTILEANGVYKHDDGTVVVEKSLQMDMLFIEKSAVLEIAKTLKVLFNQESIVLQVTELSDSTLI